MSNTKLADVVKNKKPGDEWYTYEAPEELRFWAAGSPWPKKIFDLNGLSLASVWAEAIERAGTASVVKYTQKNPLRLDCGVEVEGQLGTSLQKKGIVRFRVDGIIELNQAMKELSEASGHETWEIKGFEVYNDRKGASVSFKIFDPDTNGTSLFAYAYFRDGHRRLFPDVLQSEQKEILGDFQNRLAHCTAIQLQGLGPSCALRHKVKKRQIKLRKAKKIAPPDAVA